MSTMLTQNASEPDCPSLYQAALRRDKQLHLPRFLPHDDDQSYYLSLCRLIELSPLACQLKVSSDICQWIAAYGTGFAEDCLNPQCNDKLVYLFQDENDGTIANGDKCYQRRSQDDILVNGWCIQCKFHNVLCPCGGGSRKKGTCNWTYITEEKKTYCEDCSVETVYCSESCPNLRALCTKCGKRHFRDQSLCRGCARCVKLKCSECQSPQQMKLEEEAKQVMKELIKHLVTINGQHHVQHAHLARTMHTALEIWRKCKDYGMAIYCAAMEHGFEHLSEKDALQMVQRVVKSEQRRLRSCDPGPLGTYPPPRGESSFVSTANDVSNNNVSRGEKRGLESVTVEPFSQDSQSPKKRRRRD